MLANRLNDIYYIGLGRTAIVWAWGDEGSPKGKFGGQGKTPNIWREVGSNMQRATQGTHKDPGKEVEDFAERLQCAEEMQVCNDETVQDTMDSAWGVIDPEFAASVLENERYRSNPYYFSTKQLLLSPLMRAVLFDWMMEVSHSFRLRRETYYLAVLAVDRYLSLVANIRKEEYQLIGLAALYISAKVEEVSVRKLGEFAQSADNGFHKADITRMERRLLGSLKWKVCIGTPSELLNWLTWQWDIFLDSRFPCDIRFHSATAQSYRHYRELFQVLDLAYLDVTVLLYPPRYLALGLLYIMVSRYFQEAVFQGDLTSLDLLAQQSQQVEELFAGFLRITGLVDTLKDLFPALDYLYGFLDLQFHTENRPLVSAEQNEDLLSCQTHNPFNVAFISRKLRL